MRSLRVIAILVLFLFVAVIGTFIYSLLSPRAGRMDAYAAARIRKLCGFNAQCKVQLSDLFEGKWDTFYEFGAAVPQSEIDSVLGTNIVRQGQGQRTIVLTRGGHVVAAEHAAFGADQPLDGEIEFGDESHREQQVIRLDHDDTMRVTSFPTQPATGGTGSFYVLSQVQP